MLLKSVNGTIMEVSKVVPIVEKRESFNGTVRRRTAPAKDMMQDVSGILFLLQSTVPVSFEMGGFQMPDTAVMVGNLKRNAAEELLDSMLKNGYADLSGYAYQDATDISKLVFDHGKSAPYFLTNCMATSGLEGGMGNPFVPSYPLGWASEDSGEAQEDCSEDCASADPADTEAMRRDIAAATDTYSIRELADMSEETVAAVWAEVTG